MLRALSSEGLTVSLDGSASFEKSEVLTRLLLAHQRGI
jgi:hypothetical protein